MTDPFFSVVIPCYNSSATLQATLQSCLDQTFKSFEVILVDDCSTENIELIYLHFMPLFASGGRSISYFRMHDNGGVSKARNFGWDQAKGDYVAFLDADDLWHREKLSICHSRIVISFARVYYHAYSEGVCPNAAQLGPNNFRVRGRSFWYGLLKNFSQTSCFLVQTCVSERFDTSMRYTEDHDLWLRLSGIAPLVFLEGPALTFLGRPQHSAGGLSANRMKMRLGEMFMYRKFCKKSYIMLPLLPVLLAYSFLKHVRSEIRYFSR